MSQLRKFLSGAIQGNLKIKPEVLFAILTRIVQGIALILAAAAVILRMSSAEQGFFFGFLSFGAMLQLSDFGLSYAVLQTSSHYVATGQRIRLTGLWHRAFLVNIGFCILGMAFVALTGHFVFTRNIADQDFSPLLPWWGFILCMFITQLMAPLVAVIEGGISVISAWRFRLIQETVSGIILVVALMTGCGLWALLMFALTRMVMILVWLAGYRATFFSEENNHLTIRNWLHEVWPFQWRIGLSSLSGFFIFQAFNPIILGLKGPVEAGRFGLSLAMMNMLILVTTAWPLSQAARFGHMISQKRLKDLHSSFRSMICQSTALSVSLIVLIVLSFYFLSAWQPEYLARLADFQTTLLLLTAAFVHHLVYCLAVVMRAERRDPLLWLSVLGGMLTVISVWTAARYGVLRDVAVVNLICVMTGLPFAYAIFRRFDKRLGRLDGENSGMGQ